MTSPSDIALATRLAQFIAQGEPWMNRASCRGVGPSHFLPSRGEPTDTAYELCASCVVTEECSDYRARTGSIGIWAGRYYKHPTKPTAVTDARPVKVGIEKRKPRPAIHPVDRKQS